MGELREREIARDLQFLASDAMRGREAGTLDELRASAWVAEQARAAGLEPAGDDGTYLQFWSIRRTRLSASSRISLAGAPLTLWQDVVVTGGVSADLSADLPVVFIAPGKEADLDGIDLKGKAVAVTLARPENAPSPSVSLSSWRYARLAVQQQSRPLAQRGASAVILVADSIAEEGMSFYAAASGRGTYALDTGAVRRPGGAQVPVLLVRREAFNQVRDKVREATNRLTLSMVTETFTYPSVNIVGRVRGTDARLRDEYVLFSGHQDHDGVRYPVNGDSIWNGADDNATTSVAMLAIARAWSKHPGRRSALFVWHGAEERGLLGSRWFVEHPTVPRGAIVAVLNGDMMGRNNPDSAALLGVQPPHRNSTALVGMALAANAMTAKFHLDTLWDRPTHPEGWYFRSDHLPYARAGIPALFYSTNLHPDYHTPRDEASRIDVAKLTRMTQWMYATGWLVAQADQRPGLDPGFKLER
jgi:peptidase M28-like protein